MNPPEEVKKNLVKQWLEKAENDFNLASELLSEKRPYLEAIGFHSQQAAEKYLKAFLVHHQIEFPKTHNLDEILDLVESVNPDIAKTLKDINELNPYGVDIRYPEDFVEISDEEANRAVELASKVMDKIRDEVKKYLE
jgi:HEPN domain-containing protein